MLLNTFRTMICNLTRRSLTTASGNALEKSLNRVTLLGRVGIDPQMRGTDRSPVAVFTLATNSNYMYETGEIQQKTEWHRISVFKPHLRESVLRSMKKGSRVLVEGRIVYGEIVDVKGVTHVTSSIVAGEVIFLGNVRSANEERNDESDKIGAESL